MPGAVSTWKVLIFWISATRAYTLLRNSLCWKEVIFSIVEPRSLSFASMSDMKYWPTTIEATPIAALAALKAVTRLNLSAALDERTAVLVTTVSLLLTAGITAWKTLPEPVTSPIALEISAPATAFKAPGTLTLILLMSSLSLTSTSLFSSSSSKAGISLKAMAISSLGSTSFFALFLMMIETMKRRMPSAAKEPTMMAIRTNGSISA